MQAELGGEVGDRLVQAIGMNAGIPGLRPSGHVLIERAQDAVVEFEEAAIVGGAAERLGRHAAQEVDRIVRRPLPDLGVGGSGKCAPTPSARSTISCTPDRPAGAGGAAG
jgi:hypothetical protein